MTGRAPFAAGTPLARASHASSSEINETSSDVTADGRYRKIAHETRSERHRSLRTDEMATHGHRTRTPSDQWALRGGSNGSKSAQISHFQLQPGFLKFVVASLAYLMMVKRLRSGWRRRLGPPRASKCAPAVPSWGRVESAFGTISWVQKLFDCGFLLHLAAQLYCGAGDALGCSGRANCGPLSHENTAESHSSAYVCSYEPGDHGGYMHMINYLCLRLVIIICHAYRHLGAI